MKIMYRSSFYLSNDVCDLEWNLQSTGVVAWVSLLRHVPGLSITELFLSCGCREISQVYNIFHTCSLMFNFGEHKDSVLMQCLKVIFELVSPAHGKCVNLLENKVNIKECNWSMTRSVHDLPVKIDSSYTCYPYDHQQNPPQTIT